MRALTRWRGSPAPAHFGDPSAPLLELDEVSRTFEMEPPVHALRDVTLTVDRGAYVSIVGPSGSGKSTLLNILGCLDRQTGGVYRFEGIDTAELSEAERAGLRARRIGFVFQSFHLLPYRSIEENVMVGGLYARVPRAERAANAEAALRRVGLGHRLGFLPGRLSGGERQRVALARAVAPPPRRGLWAPAGGGGGAAPGGGGAGRGRPPPGPAGACAMSPPATSTRRTRPPSSICSTSCAPTD